MKRIVAILFVVALLLSFAAVPVSAKENNNELPGDDHTHLQVIDENNGIVPFAASYCTNCRKSTNSYDVVETKEVYKGRWNGYHRYAVYSRKVKVCWNCGTQKSTEAWIFSHDILRFW